MLLAPVAFILLDPDPASRVASAISGGAILAYGLLWYPVFRNSVPAKPDRGRLVVVNTMVLSLGFLLFGWPYMTQFRPWLEQCVRANALSLPPLSPVLPMLLSFPLTVFAIRIIHKLKVEHVSACDS